MYDNDFWEALDLLADNSEIVIDRPKAVYTPNTLILYTRLITGI